MPPAPIHPSLINLLAPLAAIVAELAASVSCLGRVYGFVKTGQRHIFCL